MMVDTFFCCLFPFYHVGSIKMQHFEERDENKAVTQQQMSKQVSVFPISGKLFLTDFPANENIWRHRGKCTQRVSTFLWPFLAVSLLLFQRCLEGVQHYEGISQRIANMIYVLLKEKRKPLGVLPIVSIVPGSNLAPP
jgi:hypothetical protein